ncbi:hypothetical protein [Streptomyces spiralis]|uniref:hypothetical protein n=1 Tax=Streptomyces spiralis TaxID=66376 RepID=UPI00369C0B03
MTKAEKATALNDIGLMVWNGAMDNQAAVWFVMRLYKVSMGEADDMVTEAMAEHMMRALDQGLKKIGDEHVGH